MESKVKMLTVFVSIQFTLFSKHPREKSQHLYSRIHLQECLLQHCLKQKEKNRHKGTSLVAQWFRIHLPMQWTRVRSLYREDATCGGATKPVRHNYWACTLEPASHNYWAGVLELLKPPSLEPVLHNKRSHRDEKPAHSNKE